MNSPDRDWWISHSGEYVLGTLEAQDRLVFETVMKHEPEIESLVRDWEQYFQSLAESIPPVEPRAELWPSIAQRIREVHTSANGVDGFPSESSIPHSDDRVLRLNQATVTAEEHVRRTAQWKIFTGLATAASLLLAVFLWNTARNPDVPDPTYNAITVVRDAQTQPVWVIDTSEGDSLIRVTAITTVEIAADKSLHLWLVKHDDAGVESMGLLPTELNESRIFSADIPSNLGTAYAVSLEPLGGSPEPVPTGPVLYQGSIQPLKL